MMLKGGGWRGRMPSLGGGGLARDDCRGFPLVTKYSTKCSSFSGKLKNCVNALVRRQHHRVSSPPNIMLKA